MSRTYIHTQQGKYKARCRKFWIKVEKERIKNGYNSTYYTIKNNLELKQEDRELELYVENLHNTEYLNYANQIKRWYWLDYDSYKDDIMRKILDKDMKIQLEEYYKNKLTDEN